MMTDAELLLAESESQVEEVSALLEAASLQLARKEREMERELEARMAAFKQRAIDEADNRVACAPASPASPVPLAPVPSHPSLPSSQFQRHANALAEVQC